MRGRNFELLSQKNRERAEEVLVRLDGSLNYLCGLAEGTKEEWADLSRLLSNAYTTDPRTNDQLTSVGVRHVSSLDLERAALKSSSQVLQLQRKGLKLLRTFL